MIRYLSHEFTKDRWNEATPDETGWRLLKSLSDCFHYQEFHISGLGDLEDMKCSGFAPFHYESGAIDGASINGAILQHYCFWCPF